MALLTTQDLRQVLTVMERLDGFNTNEGLVLDVGSIAWPGEEDEETRTLVNVAFWPEVGSFVLETKDEIELPPVIDLPQGVFA